MILKNYQIFKESIDSQSKNEQIYKNSILWVYKGDFEVTKDKVLNGRLIKEKIPDEVNGNFHCYDSKLTSLEGCPSIVRGDFYCINNQLTSLEGCPSTVGGIFNCINNKLNLTIERDFVQTRFYSSQSNYWPGLLKYMIANKIDLTKIKTWPNEFIESLDDYHKNLFKSSALISKFNL